MKYASEPQLQRLRAGRKHLDYFCGYSEESRCVHSEGETICIFVIVYYTVSVMDNRTNLEFQSHSPVILALFRPSMPHICETKKDPL